MLDIENNTLVQVFNTELILLSLKLIKPLLKEAKKPKMYIREKL